MGRLWKAKSWQEQRVGKHRARLTAITLQTGHTAAGTATHQQLHTQQMLQWNSKTRQQNAVHLGWGEGNVGSGRKLGFSQGKSEGREKIPSTKGMNRYWEGSGRKILLDLQPTNILCSKTCLVDLILREEEWDEPTNSNCAQRRGRWTSCPGWARSMISHPKWAAMGGWTNPNSHLTPPGGTSCTQGKKKTLLDFCSSHGILLCQKENKSMCWDGQMQQNRGTAQDSPSEMLGMLVFISH